MCEAMGIYDLKLTDVRYSLDEANGANEGVLVSTSYYDRGCFKVPRLANQCIGQQRSPSPGELEQLVFRG